jgi:hypothetical protein
MTDGSKGEYAVTVGLDLGDRYSYVCMLDTESGEVIEEGRLRTTPEAFGRRFGSERPMRLALEAGTHSPWASRLLPSARRMWPRGAGRRCPQDEAHLRRRTQDRQDRRREAGPPGPARPSSTGASLPRRTWR